MTDHTALKTETPSPSGSSYDSEKPPVADVEAAATTNPTKNGQGQGRQIRGARWALACVAIFSANWLYGLDSTIAADLQSAVSISLDNVTERGWLAGLWLLPGLDRVDPAAGQGICAESTISDHVTEPSISSRP